MADDATAAQVETALEALNVVDEVTVTGSAGGPWTVTFVDTHAGSDLVQMNGDAAALTSGTEIREITYTYDAASQLTEVSDPDSTYAYTYDNLGRVLTVDNDGTSGVANVVLTSAYDANSNRTSLLATIDSSGDFLNDYTYDALNRLIQIEQSATGSSSVNEKRVDLSYNALGQFSSIARFNDLDGTTGDEVATSTYTYDTLGRLTDLAYKNGGTNLFTPYEWAYDNLSRITQMVSADGTSDYEYDKTSQLTDADHDYQTDEAYTYDANGNRTMTGYTTGDNNQLTNDRTYTYTYDDEGNRITRTNDTTSEVTEYEWDFRNRLVKVTEKDDMGTTTQVVAYTYDIFNRRIAKAVDTTSPFTLTDAALERYIIDDVNGVTSVDGGNVVLDFLDPDGSGSSPLTLNSRLLFGNAVDQILAQEDLSESTSSADRVLWHLGDHLATVRDLVKNDGTLGAHYEYDSYGQIVSGDTSVTRYLYTSREYDEATGLQYNRARWYEAEAGRWITEDPLSFAAGDTNLNRYVGNQSTGAADPSGLWSFLAHLELLKKTFEDKGIFTSEEIVQMAKLGKGMDLAAVKDGWIGKTVDTKGYYEHFLIVPGLDATTSFVMAENSVNQHLTAAKIAAEKEQHMVYMGARLDAHLKKMTELAAAFHTIMDSTSPAHVDAQGYPMAYEGENLKRHSPNEWMGMETAKHITDDIQQRVTTMMLDAYEAYIRGTDFTFPKPLGFGLPLGSRAPVIDPFTAIYSERPEQ